MSVERTVELLERLAAKAEEEKSRTSDPYLRGLKQGTSDAFLLAARWVREDLDGRDESKRIEEKKGYIRDLYRFEKCYRKTAVDSSDKTVRSIATIFADWMRDEAESREREAEV